MHFSTSTPVLALGLSLLKCSIAQSSIVTGTAPGFADGVTGGGDAAPVYPDNIDDLISYLTSPEPQNIVISGTYDFVGSEGTQAYDACNAYDCTPDESGQALLNTLNACSGATYSVDLDVAGYRGIDVTSDKTLVGQGSKAVLNGKGLRFVGVSNIIVQNIAITNLNPTYVWGGDALTFSETSDIWIDHVTTSLLGRQHYSFGQAISSRITVSNSFLNGETTHSSTCDGHSYWGFEMVGEGDTITLFQNYVYYTSGRSPAVSGSTLLHAVNNVFEDNSGHLIEGQGSGLFEGNVFADITTTVDAGFTGKLFGATAGNAGSCATYLGRDCEANQFESAGAIDFEDTDFLADFEGLTIVDAASAADIATEVPANAGNTLAGPST